MRTFARKPKATQQTKAADSTKLGRAFSGQSRETHSATTTPTRFGYEFGRIPIFNPSPIRIQSKLIVNTPGDVYEQEADRVADQVMRMPERQAKQYGPVDQIVHTKRVRANDAGKPVALPIVHDVLHSPGQPMESNTRGFMEPRFGHDFSQVRIHSGSLASRSAQSIQALAYTGRNHIVFGEQQYQPNTLTGRRLLAHELTHVLQQTQAHGCSADLLPPIQTNNADLIQRQLDDEDRLQVLQNRGIDDLITLFADSYLPENEGRLVTVHYGSGEHNLRRQNHYLPRLFLAQNRPEILRLIRSKLLELHNGQQIQRLRQVRSRIDNEPRINLQRGAVRDQLRTAFDEVVGVQLEQALSSTIGFLKGKVRTFILIPLRIRYRSIHRGSLGTSHPSASALGQMGTGARIYVYEILTLAAQGSGQNIPGRAGAYREMALRAAQETWDPLSGEQRNLLDSGWSDLNTDLTEQARTTLAEAYRRLGQHDIEIQGEGVDTVVEMAARAIPAMPTRPLPLPIQE